MSTITYLYDLGASVFFIDDQHAIKPAVVKTATALVQYGGTTISYTVALQDASGVHVASEDSLYPDADTALAA